MIHATVPIVIVVCSLVGNVLSNFLWQWWTDRDFERAGERSFYQAVLALTIIVGLWLTR
jgi:hypothetical protein